MSAVVNAYRAMSERARTADPRQPFAMLADPLLLAILALALALRLYVALTTSHIWDEDRDWVLMASRISFAPDHPYLPIRSFNHGALPAYLIKLGSMLFGETIAGFRIFSVLLGTCTVAVTALIAHAWAGRAAALWAGAFIAFNEFHAMVSAIATDKVYSIFFGALAAYWFVRALQEDRPRVLLWAALFAALSILCYEIMYLLIPAFAVAVLFSKRRVWFLSPYLYVAAVLGLVVLLPDLLWNLNAANAGEMSYAGHLDRFGGIGFTQHYLLFFFRDAVVPLYAAMGRSIHDGFGEYAVMNIVLGVLLFAAALFWSWRFAASRERRAADPALLFLLTTFWLILGLFSLLQPGEGGRLDNRGWPWVQFILVPAAVFAGAMIAQAKGAPRVAFAAIAGLGVAYGAVHIATWRFGLPAYTMTLLPQSDTNAEMIDYRAVLHACATCDPEPRLELVSLTGEPFPGAEAPPLQAEDIVGAEIGAPDTEFALRKVERRGYTATYRLTTSAGASHELSVNT